MDMVETPGAFVLQQAADDRLRAMARNAPLGRYRIRRALFVAGHWSTRQRAHLAVHECPGRWTHRLLSHARLARRTARGSGINSHDHRSAVGALLDRSHAGGVARRKPRT